MSDLYCPTGGAFDDNQAPEHKDNSMIRTIHIENFRCFRLVEVKDLKRINVIVGDNGAGKTALLEAIFLALGSSPEIAMRLRQWRGLDASFQGAPRQLEEALWGDLFHNLDTKETIRISLSGGRADSRSVSIYTTAPNTFVSTARSELRGFRPTTARVKSEAGIVFDWRDGEGHIHTYRPKITQRGIELPGPEEELPDFFFFAASVPSSSIENATRFSALSRDNRKSEFVELFTSQYPDIEDLNVEVIGGAPAIYATLKNVAQKVPVTAVSGAVNRFLGILLAIASTRKSVVIVDEADSGIYFKRHEAYWRALLAFAAEYDAQLFLSTHNEEWLSAGAKVLGPEASQASLLRVERDKQTGTPVIRHFTGDHVIAGIEAGEVR